MVTATGPGPSVTVVIPALNEAEMIRPCLEALLAQTVPADEIIVVDNGSADDTVAICESYPGITVLREPRRGITYGRTTGFDAARCDVIARIDADTVVAADWIATLKELFGARPGTDAIAGGAGIAELSPKGRIWFSWWYRGFRAWHQRSIGVRPMLYGFNSALRRSAWARARPIVTLDDRRVSEDVDVTVSLLMTGSRLEFSPRLRVKAHLFRSMNAGKLSEYYRTDDLTLARHGYGKPRRRARGEAMLAEERAASEERA